MAEHHSSARILTCYYRPKPGGFCRRLFQAIEALLAQGHTVHYLSVVEFPVSHPRCVHHRFLWPPTRTDNLLFWGWFHLSAPFVLLYLALRHRATHGFVFGHNYGLLMQAARVSCRIPLTVFLRADVLETHRLKNRSRWLIRLETLLEGVGLHGTRVYCVSEALARRVRADRRVAKPALVAVLPNALPASSETPKHAKNTRPLRLVAAGILEERKNFALLIETMALLDRECAQLSIYGNGPYERRLATLVRTHRLEDRVYLKGWTEHPETIWRHHDLLLFPSRHEGSPNIVLEALAAGVPVLASDIPEHREFLPPSSLLSVDNIQAWVATLNKIIGDPDRHLADLRRQQIKAAAHLHFDWDRTVIQAILR